MANAHLIEMKADGTLVGVLGFDYAAQAEAFLVEAVRDFGARPERVVISGATLREVFLPGLLEFAGVA